MEALEEVDSEGALGLATWLQNGDVAAFQQEVEEKIIRFLFNPDLEEARFFQTMQMLAWIGSSKRSLYGIVAAEWVERFS